MQATIDGVTYQAVKGDFPCSECDIFKAKPPRHMADYPLCYFNTYHHHYIHQYCGRHGIVWRVLQNPK